MTPVVYVICQTGALANGGLESVTQILTAIRAPRIVVTDKHTRFTDRWKALGCDVHVWPIPEDEGAENHLKTRASRVATMALYNARVAALVRERGARVVHANDIRAFWFAAPGARAAGARVLFNVRDILDRDRSYGPKWKATHHLASEIVCLSNDMLATVLERFPPLFSSLPGRAGLSVVYSAVDLDRMRPLAPEERKAMREALWIPEETFEIAYVGVLCEKKNQLEFLRKTAPILAERIPRSRVTFVGKFAPSIDPYAKACADAARDLCESGHVRFAGFDPQPERYYQASDVVALASRYEGLPRCMIEGLSCGTPVVAFDVTSVREFLEEKGCGIAVRLHDHEGLADGIARLAEDPALRAKMAVRAREVALESFAPEKSVGAYAATYERLAAS